MSSQDNGASSQPNPLLESVHDDMLDGLGQLSDYFGFSKVFGQLYGALLMSPRPMSLDDMVERLSISKANVSINMRTLENMGMVRQVWVKGSSARRKYYAAETDFWEIISNILKGREMRDVGRALDVMDANIKRLKSEAAAMSPEDRATAEVYIDRMRQMRELFEFARSLIEMILGQVEDVTPTPDKRVADDDWTP